MIKEGGKEVGYRETKKSRKDIGHFFFFSLLRRDFR